MTPNTIQLILACSASIHLVISCVFGLYARHKIDYLCLAVVNAFFGFFLIGASLFGGVIAYGQPGIMHPVMLLVLLAGIFLQSIYPLSIPMPGFLQWGRMLYYAQPAIFLIALYIFGRLLGSKLILLHSFSDVRQNLLSGDVLMRLAALGLSVYYILNIFRLPRRMARTANVPAFLIGYCTVLGMSVVYYTVVAIFYDATLIMIYVVVFTLLNLYLAFRILEIMACSLPKPIIKAVEKEPEPEKSEGEEGEDFNEANLHRFQRIEYWMQTHQEEWRDNTFGRDRLCEAVGYNRHLTLQSIRSQGYNNVHEYINSYRVEELKRLIVEGKITSVRETVDVGFGAPKTARSAFERIEGHSLDEYLANQSSKTENA